MDCLVHEVAKSRTQLSNFHFHIDNFILNYKQFLLQSIKYIKIIFVYLIMYK